MIGIKFARKSQDATYAYAILHSDGDAVAEEGIVIQMHFFEVIANNFECVYCICSWHSQCNINAVQRYSMSFFWMYRVEAFQYHASLQSII